jgi:hypothetical protein
MAKMENSDITKHWQGNREIVVHILLMGMQNDAPLQKMTIS